MPISSGDIKLKLSGGAANAVASASLGGAASSADMPELIFDTVTGEQSAAGAVEYRCVYIKNNDPVRTMYATVAWFDTNTPNIATNLSMGLGTSAMNAVEQVVAAGTTAPTGVTFTSPDAKNIGVAIGNIPPLQTRALWLRRSVTAGAAATTADTFGVKVECDSEA
jgi:hypothetical protein